MEHELVTLEFSLIYRESCHTNPKLNCIRRRAIELEFTTASCFMIYLNATYSFLVDRPAIDANPVFCPTPVQQIHLLNVLHAVLSIH